MATATTRREEHISLATPHRLGVRPAVRDHFLVFMAGPILASLALSFTDFGLRDLRNPLGTNFIGLHNYIELAGDPTFRIASFNTAYFVLVGVPLTLGPRPGGGTRLDRGIWWFRTIFRVGYYLPVVTSIVAVAVVWRFVLNPDYGLLNMTLGAIGINGRTGWAPTLAMPSLIVMAAWRNLGFAMVLFLPDSRPSPSSCTRPPPSTAPAAGPPSSR